MYSQTQHGLWFLQHNFDPWWYLHICQFQWTKHHNSSDGKCQWLFKSSLSPWHRWFGRRFDPQWLSQRISFWNSTHPTGRSIEHIWWCLGCMVKSFHWRLSNISLKVLDLVAEAVANVTTLKVWMLWRVGTCGMLSCHVNCSVAGFHFNQTVIWQYEGHGVGSTTFQFDWPENFAGCHYQKPGCSDGHGQQLRFARVWVEGHTNCKGVQQQTSILIWWKCLVPP